MAPVRAGLHENPDRMDSETIDRHRALVSLIEELEAVDWYSQRVEAASDEELRAILVHNRDEEKEHAAMVLEWLRRHDAHLDAQMRGYLFIDQSIQERARQLEDASAVEVPGGDCSLAIGDLRGVRS